MTIEAKTTIKEGVEGVRTPYIGTADSRQGEEHDRMCLACAHEDLDFTWSEQEAPG